MVFFPQPEPKIDDFDRNAAKKLASFFRAKRVKYQYRENAWAAEFAAIRQIDGKSRESVEINLCFYIENFRGKFIPVVFSAAGFRKKFDAINAARLRAPVPVANIRISPTAYKIIDSVAPIWNDPKQRDTAPAMVQLTMERYSAFFDGLCRGYERYCEDAQRMENAQAMKNGTISSDTWGMARIYKHLISIAAASDDFARDHLRAVHSWKNAPRDLTGAAWNPRLRGFVTRFGGDIVAYGAAPAVAEIILREIEAG
jgi:hypothetical protein